MVRNDTNRKEMIKLQRKVKTDPKEFITDEWFAPASLTFEVCCWTCGRREGEKDGETARVRDKVRVRVRARVRVGVGVKVRVRVRVRVRLRIMVRVRVRVRIRVKLRLGKGVRKGLGL